MAKSLFRVKLIMEDVLFSNSKLGEKLECLRKSVFMVAVDKAA